MKTYLAILSAFLLFACSSTPPIKLQDLPGYWEPDSAYFFYNGFGHTEGRRTGWGSYTYDDNGKVRESMGEQFREYVYRIEGMDSLIFETPSGEEMARFQILYLQDNRMVVKKDKTPLFPGKNQQRYEVRYFSRTEP